MVACRRRPRILGGKARQRAAITQQGDTVAAAGLLVAHFRFALALAAMAAGPADWAHRNPDGGTVAVRLVFAVQFLRVQCFLLIIAFGNADGSPGCGFYYHGQRRRPPCRQPLASGLKYQCGGLAACAWRRPASWHSQAGLPREDSAPSDQEQRDVAANRPPPYQMACPTPPAPHQNPTVCVCTSMQSPELPSVGHMETRRVEAAALFFELEICCRRSLFGSSEPKILQI